MLLADQIALYSTIFAAFATIAGFIYTWRQYLSNQRQQQAAQTREVLQAIVRNCSQFLRPLSEQFPYPILHTATAITKEFCSRMKDDPRGDGGARYLSVDMPCRSHHFVSFSITNYTMPFSTHNSALSIEPPAAPRIVL